MKNPLLEHIYQRLVEDQECLEHGDMSSHLEHIYQRLIEDQQCLQKIVFMANHFVNENNFTYDGGAIHEHMAEVKFIHELVTFIEENVIHHSMIYWKEHKEDYFDGDLPI